MFTNIGFSEISLVVLGLIVIFGGDKIMGLAKKLGETTAELNKVKESYQKAITVGPLDSANTTVQTASQNAPTPAKKPSKKKN